MANAVPPGVGVSVLGEIAQVGGAPLPQLRLTEFAYPFRALKNPYKVAG